MNINAVELIGYLGSILVAISLMMKSLLRLRLINLFGALFFTFYGVLLGAYPVAFLNGLIVCIDLYYLFQMWRQKDFFTFLELLPNSKYMRSFVEFYKDDILEIIPNYTHNTDDDLLCFFILRNMMPAGLSIAKVQGSVLPWARNPSLCIRWWKSCSPELFRENGICESRGIIRA